MITNPKAVHFTATKARSIANLLGTLRRTLPQFALEVVSEFEDVTGSDQAADIVQDANAETKPVSKENIAQLKFVCEQIDAALNQDDRAAIVNRIATTTQPLF